MVNREPMNGNNRGTVDHFAFVRLDADTNASSRSFIADLLEPCGPCPSSEYAGGVLIPAAD